MGKATHTLPAPGKHRYIELVLAGQRRSPGNRRRATWNPTSVTLHNAFGFPLNASPFQVHVNMCVNMLYITNGSLGLQLDGKSIKRSA